MRLTLCEQRRESGLLSERVGDRGCEGRPRDRGSLVKSEHSARDPSTNIASLFLEFWRTMRMDQDWPRPRSWVESLTGEQVWWRPSEATNSAGSLLLLHLNGNLQQWIVGSLDRLADTWDRSAESAERHHLPTSVLLQRLGATLQQASAVLSRLTNTRAEHHVSDSGIYRDRIAC